MLLNKNPFIPFFSFFPWKHKNCFYFAIWNSPSTKLPQKVNNSNCWDSLVEVPAEEWWEQSLSGNGPISLSLQDSSQKPHVAESAPDTVSYTLFSWGLLRNAPAWEGIQRLLFPHSLWTILHDFTIRIGKATLGQCENVLVVQVFHVFNFWHTEMRRHHKVKIDISHSLFLCGLAP